MGLFARRPPDRQGYVKTLQAAARVVDTEKDDSRGSNRRAAQWQTQAWGYYDSVGELHYSANFIGACLSRVRLMPGLLDEAGQPGPVFGDVDPATELPELLHPLGQAAREVIDDLRSPVGGQPHLLRSFGINLSVAGECHLLGSEDGNERRWEVLSVDELRAEGKEYKRLVGLNDQGEKIPAGSLLVRIWRPHPRFSDQADASTRAVLEVLEELQLLTRDVRATATSRLAGAGVLWVAEEIDYPGAGEAAAGSEEADPFTTDLLTAMTTPISDRGSAAAVVPMVVRAPGEWIERGIRFDSFASKSDAYPSVALRNEAVQRIAQGIDLPVEIVTGQGGANHWSAWQIDESTFKAHIEPLLELITDALTTGYLRPALLAEGGRTEEDVAPLVVTFDASELVVHPNRGNDATLLYDRIELSGRVLRAANGFSEDDAPDDEERERRLGEAERTAPGVAAPPGGNTPEQGSDEVTPGAPEGANLTERIAAAAEVTIERAVERAGARLRSKANGHSALRDSIGRAPAYEVASLLGPAHVAELIPQRDLFAGEFAALGRSICKWAAEDGIVDAGAVAERALAVVEQLAMARLYGAAEVSAATFAGAVGPPAPPWPRIVHADG